MECPKCGSDEVTGSHRRGGEKILRYFYPRAPYRCKECWNRFWVFKNPFDTTVSKLIVLAIILIIAVPLYLANYQKKNTSSMGRNKNIAGNEKKTEIIPDAGKIKNKETDNVKAGSKILAEDAL